LKANPNFGTTSSNVPKKSFEKKINKSLVLDILHSNAGSCCEGSNPSTLIKPPIKNTFKNRFKMLHQFPEICEM